MRKAWILAPIAGTCLGALAVGGLSCAALDSIEPNRCGNEVFEPDAGEACDTVSATDGFANGEVGACGTPGSAAECRQICGTTVKDDAGSHTSMCPSSTVCSLADGICRADPADGGIPAFEPLGPTIGTQPRALLAGDFDGDGLGDVLAVSFSSST